MTDRLRIVPAALGRDVLVRGAAEIGFAELLRDATMPAAPAPATMSAAPAAAPSTTHTSGRDDAAEEARTA